MADKVSFSLTNIEAEVLGEKLMQAAADRSNRVIRVDLNVDSERAELVTLDERGNELSKVSCDLLGSEQEAA